VFGIRSLDASLLEIDQHSKTPKICGIFYKWKPGNRFLEIIRERSFVAWAVQNSIDVVEYVFLCHGWTISVYRLGVDEVGDSIPTRVPALVIAEDISLPRLGFIIPP